MLDFKYMIYLVMVYVEMVDAVYRKPLALV